MLEDGTGAGADVACAAATAVGRKPARKDLGRRAAALVTTFLGWAEAVLEIRGADIEYYCYYMNRDRSLVVAKVLGLRWPGCCPGACGGAEVRITCCEGGGSFWLGLGEIRTMMQMEFLVGYYQGAAWGRQAPTHGCLSELQGPTGRVLQPSLYKSGSFDRPRNGTWAPWSAPHPHCMRSPCSCRETWAMSILNRFIPRPSRLVDCPMREPEDDHLMVCGNQEYDEQCRQRVMKSARTRMSFTETGPSEVRP